MRFRLLFFLLFVTALSAAAQAPVKTVINYIPVYPPAEIHFADGKVRDYPVMRISKDMIRVESGDSQSIRMPLTYVESIKFKDGCTLFFDKGEFQFDKLVTPARLKNDSGSPLLEGVLELNPEQARGLMGPETYRQFRNNSRILKAGEITMLAGFTAVVPYIGMSIYNKELVSTFKDMSNTLKGVTIGGGCVLIAGIVVAIIGNSGCNRVVASYNDGIGLAYTF